MSLIFDYGRSGVVLCHRDLGGDMEPDDEIQPVEPSEQLPEHIRLLSNHLVGLTWYQSKTNADGKHVAKPEWHAASAFIVELEGICWLATAGHVFTDVQKEMRKDPDLKIEAPRVWDGWSLSKEYRDPIPYDFFDDTAESISVTELEKGIDLTLIPVRHYLANLLSQTTLPFPREHWLNAHTADYTAYYIVGTPTCLAEEEITSTVGNVSYIRNEFRPFIVRVEPIDQREVSPTEHDQFVARIHPGWKIESIRGMSGGVILAFSKRDDGQVFYRPIAIQSRWIERKRIVIGTYLSPCLEAFEEVFRDPTKFA